MTSSNDNPFFILALVVKKFRIGIDGNIQFSSRDEYRYHEPLVHIPMGLALNREQVLILGGGEGLAAPPRWWVITRCNAAGQVLTGPG